jgi:hypothetical protein
MPPSEKPPIECSCISDPFAALPPELRPTASRNGEKSRRFGLRKVTCPGCGLTYTTNRNTDLCVDCERRGVKSSSDAVDEGNSLKMLTIKVLGPGCAKCEYLEQRAQLALADIQAEYPDVKGEIQKVTDVNVFMQYGLLITPGLVINEKLVCAGQMPASKTITGWLNDALGVAS